MFLITLANIITPYTQAETTVNTLYIVERRKKVYVQIRKNISTNVFVVLVFFPYIFFLLSRDPQNSYTILLLVVYESHVCI